MNRCLTIVLAALLAGCINAPVQEMSDARQALSAAVAAGAERYSPDHFQRAQDLLGVAEVRLAAGAYGDAKRYAVDARYTAIRAREIADDERPR